MDLTENQLSLRQVFLNFAETKQQHRGIAKCVYSIYYALCTLYSCDDDKSDTWNSKVNFCIQTDHLYKRIYKFCMKYFSHADSY
jgi:hypothetical protein